jgi:hypothetical protein
MEVGLTELESRRALRTFEVLFALAEFDPWTAAKLLNEAAISQAPYPGAYAGIYLLGLIQGACCASEVGYLATLKALRHHHPDFMAKAPSDFIGPKRIYGRGKGME